MARGSIAGAGGGSIGISAAPVGAVAGASSGAGGAACGDMSRGCGAPASKANEVAGGAAVSVAVTARSPITIPIEPTSSAVRRLAVGGRPVGRAAARCRLWYDSGCRCLPPPLRSTALRITDTASP